MHERWVALKHKFCSNYKEVLSQISPEDMKDIDIFNDNFPIECTLGVQWNIKSDTFQSRIVLNDKPLIRRGIYYQLLVPYTTLLVSQHQ